ncbi:M42 family peptidase [bacterium]|nr:MAG: M42 family peptidase [bacterium]
MNWKLLEELSNTPGAPGHEEAIANIFKRELENIATEIETDPMGNVIAHIPGDGPQVELDAHTDEVAFIVSNIDDDGFVRVQPLGGIDPRVFYAQRLVIHGKKDLIGIVGAVPPHLTRGKETDRDKSVPIEDAFIDLGLSAEKVRESVSVGDIVTFHSVFHDTGEAVIGKAFDDRVGVFAMIEAAKNVKKPACDLFLVAAVQEERGLRGAPVAAYKINPDIAIAIEGTLANDLPDAPAHKRLACQGYGPEIRITDRLAIMDRSLVRFLGELAERKNIPHQFMVKSVGTTNVSSIQTTAGGVRVAAISVAVRYIHGPNGLVNKRDIENQIALIKAFLENADKTPPR